MQDLYKDGTLYFRVLPRDFVFGYLRKFCINYRHINSFSIGASPSHVSFDLEGNVVVTLFAYNEVRVYSSTYGVRTTPWGRTDGVMLRNIGSPEDPMSCVVSETGCFYVVEDDWVGEFSPAGEKLRSIGQLTDNSPYSVAVLKNQLWVCYSTFLTVFDIGTEAILHQHGKLPWGPITNIGDNQVAMLSGRLMYIFDENCTVVREFYIGKHKYSNGLAYDSKNDILCVVDLNDGCLLYDLYGDFLGKFEFGFRNPLSVAFSTGALCVGDKGGFHLFE